MMAGYIYKLSRRTACPHYNNYYDGLLVQTHINYHDGPLVSTILIIMMDRLSTLTNYRDGLLVPTILKSVQSALNDLLTTSATHGTFSRPSTKRGLILIGLELNTNARESFEHC